MMHDVTNIARMNIELHKLVSQAQMKFDCGAGGILHSEVAIVSEAPGEKEIELKQPLVGGSGKYLWDIIRKQGITRGNCYTTNVIKRQLLTAYTTDSGKGKKLTLPKGELNTWKGILLDELSQLPNLKYIIALGNYALEALTGETGITHYRGSVLPIRIGERVIQCICTFNPAHVMREPKHEIVFRMDLAKLTRVKDGTFSPPKINAIINPSFKEAMEYVRFAEKETLPIAYDIETLNGHTACIGLAHSSTEGICIPFRDSSTNFYAHSEERELRLALQRLFQSPNARLVCQNGMFDSTWLWWMDRIRVKSNWFDTMLAHHVLYPPLPHNLGFITAQYTDLPYYKDDGKEWRETNDLDRFWRYNVTDCCITLAASEKMLEELRAENLDAFFFNHVMRLQPHLARMTVGGVLADVRLKQSLVDSLTVSTEAARAVCNEAAQTALNDPQFTFNPRSWRDLTDLFFTKLKLVGRGSSTDKENRERMLKHPRTNEAARRVINSIDFYLGETKFLSTYAASRLDSDDRFRCEYKQTGVQSAPGRLSSSGTMWGNGLNLQNIPERAKGMLIADPGYEFTYFDLSQVEARFVACFANISTWLHQFELARLNPGTYDAHCALAADMFKVPYDEVPKHDFESDGTKTIRFISKRCRHGLNYRMAADRLASTAGLSIHEAEKAYNIYHHRTPELRDWWQETINEVREKRYLDTPLGRRWKLLERFDTAALDSIIAFRPQATAGDWVSSVIYKCEDDPQWPADARISMNIHDALIAINRPVDGPLVRSIMKKYAEEPIMINGHSMIVPAEFGVSQSDEYGIHRWSTIKKIK